MPLKMNHDALAMTEYRDDPAVLVLADSEEGFARAARSAERAECRISASLGLEGALERLDRQVAATTVIADFEQDHGPPLDRLLERLEAGARTGLHRSVICAPAELIDVISARTLHQDVIHLCAPTELDRVMAIGIACARPPARLHDIGKGQGPARLQQLSEEVGRIATILANLSEDELLHEPAAVADHAAQGELSSATVRSILRLRRLRGEYLSRDLFADPAWDMLLDLMAARLDNQRVAVSSLCIAAAVPPTTALRWIKTLTDQGLFVRTADPQDGRRVFIELSDDAAAKLAAYLLAVQRISPLAI
jgi:DNA-binding MarR family transcriptional regulator